MSTRLYPRHVPQPARGLAASHRELRQALAALRVVSHGATCPPAGHALWSMLSSAASDLDAALARHFDHEREFAARGQGQLAPALKSELEEDHTRLFVLSVGLTQLVLQSVPGDERAWPLIRIASNRVIDTLSAHLDREDRLLLHPDSAGPLRVSYSPSIA